MFSQPKSNINMALCLMAIFMTAFTTRAQLSNVPHRHRNKIDHSNPEEHGRKQRQQTAHQHQRKQMNERKLEGDLSDMSMPSSSTTSLRMMSIPLQEMRLDMSMPMSDPRTLDVDESVTMGTGSDPDESTVILASFLVGMTALVFGAMALFVKMRQVHRRELNHESMQEVVSPLSPNSVVTEAAIAPFFNDDNDHAEGEMQEIVVV